MPEAKDIQLRRSGSGPPIILLPGLGHPADVWDRLPGLAGRFERVVCDLSGVIRRDTFEIEDLAEMLAEALSAERIERGHVVGSGFGGMIALCLAAAMPMRVDRMVLCDTSPGLSEDMRETLLTRHGNGPAEAAMARADLLDFAEDVHARTLVLCADGADLAMRDGAVFLARSMPSGQLAFVPGAMSDAILERPDWMGRVLLDFLG